MKSIIRNEWYKVVFKDENKVVAIFSGNEYNYNDEIYNNFIKCIKSKNVSKLHLVFDYSYCKIYSAMDRGFENRIKRLLYLIYNNNPKIRVFIYAGYSMRVLIYVIGFNRLAIKIGDAQYIPTVFYGVSHNRFLWFRIGNDHNKCRYFKISMEDCSIVVEDDIMPERAIEESKGGINQ